MHPNHPSGRPSESGHRLELKQAFRALLRQAGGGDSFTWSTRVGAPALSRYGAPHEDDCHVPADVILDLELDTGAPLVTSALARLQGWRLERLQGSASGAPAVAASPARLAADHVGRAADLFATVENCLRDGRLDAAERAELQSALAKAGLALLAVQKAVTA